MSTRPPKPGRKGRERILTGCITGSHHDYRAVNLTTPRGPRLTFVHKLVLLAFQGPMPEHFDAVRHLNGNGLDNRLSNLAYGTHSENQYDQVAHGRHANARKTACPRGHEYTPENTSRRLKSSGTGYFRTCLACKRLRYAEKRNQQKVAA